MNGPLITPLQQPPVLDLSWFYAWGDAVIAAGDPVGAFVFLWGVFFPVNTFLLYVYDPIVKTINVVLDAVGLPLLPVSGFPDWSTTSQVNGADAIEPEPESRDSVVSALVPDPSAASSDRVVQKRKVGMPHESAGTLLPETPVEIVQGQPRDGATDTGQGLPWDTLPPDETLSITVSGAQSRPVESKGPGVDRGNFDGQKRAGDQLTHQRISGQHRERPRSK